MSKNNTMSQNPIGVMDSGVGGISVLKHIHAQLPHEALIYYADSRYAPYGNRSPQEIQQRCFAIADFLIAQQVKAIVVACNTATAAAIAEMRARYTLPIIGMEPAVKPAAAASKNGIVGVLATVGTLKSAQFAGLLESYGRNVKVVTQGCVGLVECIERGELDAAHTHDLIQQYTAPLLAEGADTIVLGCTHYPFLRAHIQNIVGDHISIIDTGAAVAKQLQHKLIEQQLSTDHKGAPHITFYSNNQQPEAASVIEMLWGQPTHIQLLP